MTVSLAERIPCRYLVVKYVDDDTRDEPINIGIIMQSQSNNKTISKFITNYHKIRTGGEDISILKEILDNIHNEISGSSDKNILEKVSTKYSGKIRFTEPRGTLARNMDVEANYLFERYISIEELAIEKTEKITLPIIRKHIWRYLEGDYKGLAKRNTLIHGKQSKFRYDFMLGQKKRILYTISYDSRDALKKTELFDWNAKDAIEGNGLEAKSFGIILAEPNPANTQYEKMKAQFNVGYKILESRNYNLISFDQEEEWKKEIRVLI